MKLEIDSRIGEHTIGKIKYIGSVSQLSLYDALIDRKGDKEIKILGRSNIADNTGNSTEKNISEWSNKRTSNKRNDSRSLDSRNYSNFKKCTFG